MVDKENGKTKADASNAGINVAKYPYFICTDVDCVLDREALSKMILPIIRTKTRVIAVGATMRMVNSCEVKDGVMVETKLPTRIFPLYQEIEYLRINNYKLKQKEVERVYSVDFEDKKSEKYSERVKMKRA